MDAIYLQVGLMMQERSRAIKSEISSQDDEDDEDDDSVESQNYQAMNCTVDGYGSYGWPTQNTNDLTSGQTTSYSQSTVYQAQANMYGSPLYGISLLSKKLTFYS
jgi:hypothetical protein